jgi:hypothetical protein
VSAAYVVTNLHLDLIIGASHMSGTTWIEIALALDSDNMPLR